MVYLLARKWRGVINISSMRTFSSRPELETFIKKSDEVWYGPEPYHVYVVHNDERDAVPMTLKEMRLLGLRPKRGETK
jgi:hypothetical protein